MICYPSRGSSRFLATGCLLLASFVLVSHSLPEQADALLWGQEPEQAGNAEVARIMREFPGRGDLGDGSLPRTPEETVATLRVADDLRIELVASEPQIAQPIHVSFDPRGRMWVVEYRQYPFPAGLKVVRYDQHLRAVFDRVPNPPPQHVRGADRISVFSDTDGDGHYESQRVVLDGLNIATSAAVGEGGLWVMNPPYLLFYPDSGGDLGFEENPVVHLSGFGLEDTHSVANSLLLGPDGWLYGVNGSTTTARVVVHLGQQSPLAYEGQCVWRYHVRQHRFEIFAEGGGNPFGLEFDAEGEIFSGSNWGETRGMHYVQGAYGVKSWGKHGPLTNPYAYGYFHHMPHQGDGRRFTEEMIVYNDTRLPSRYHGNLIAVNPLQRIVFASRKLALHSTFRTEDYESFIETSDRWFRPVDVALGPDGLVYFADWYDTRLTHVDPRDNWHKGSGRIYRVGPKDSSVTASGFEDLVPVRTRFDLPALADDDLIRLLGHPNRLLRFHAVEQLAARFPRPQAADRTPAALRRLLIEHDSRQLEALWAYGRIAGIDALAADEELLQALRHCSSSPVRRWLVRLLGDHHATEPAAIAVLMQLALHEQDPRARAQLAATAKRIPGDEGLKLAINLIVADLPQDREDPLIPLLLWWAVEAHCDRSHASLVDQITGNMPLWQSALYRESILSRLVRRCVVLGSTDSFALCEMLLRKAPDDDCRRRMMRGLDEGLADRPANPLPSSLAEVLTSMRELSPLAALKQRLRQGEPEAVPEAFALIRDPQVSVLDRTAIIELLGAAKLAGSVPPLIASLQDSSVAVRRAALQSLSRFEEPEIGEAICAGYQSMDSSTGLRPIAVRILASRASWAHRLIAEIEGLRIPREVVSADMVLQMQSHEDPLLREKLLGLWGAVRPTPEEKRVQVERLVLLAQEGGDPLVGKKLFAQHCGKCHRLHGEGGDVGPDLTGYERSNFDFLSLAIADPSAAIREEYTNYRLLTVDGQLLTGLLVDRSEYAVQLRTAEGQTLRFPLTEVESLQASPISLMPEDSLQSLGQREIRDLLSYITAGG